MTRPISSRSITSSLSTGTALGRLALGLAVGAAASGYGRGAYAGTCSPIGGLGTYLCSGPADATTDVTQNFGPVSGDLTIVSLPGFGLDTSLSGGDGVSASALFQDGSDDIAISTGNVTGRVNGISTNASSGLPGYVGDRIPRTARPASTRPAGRSLGSRTRAFAPTASLQISRSRRQMCKPPKMASMPRPISGERSPSTRRAAPSMRRPAVASRSRAASIRMTSRSPRPM